MNELIAALLLVAASYTNMTVPADKTPTIEMVTRAELTAAMCHDGQPCGIRAMYTPGGKIYLGNDLKPGEDIYDTSILLHELTHWLQHTNGRNPSRAEHEAAGTEPTCRHYVLLEQEAYAAQNRFLVTNGGGMRRVLPPRFICPAEEPK
jgi:hypothetical protein